MGNVTPRPPSALAGAENSHVPEAACPLGAHLAVVGDRLGGLLRPRQAVALGGLKTAPRLPGFQVPFSEVLRMVLAQTKP